MDLSRRRFLALSATVVVAACSGSDADDSAGPASDPSAGSAPGSATTAATTPTTTPPTAPAETDAPTTTTTVPEVELAADPFVFGVASGDPDESSVVLWTRLGGDLGELGEEELTLAWEFTPDEGDSTSGTTTVDASAGHTAHVVAPVDGPGSFTFSVGGWTSPTGRTAPLDPSAGELRLAAASCQNYEAGFYAAHRDIAEWSPDLVLFLGDFIYENDARPVGGGVVRSHEGPEPTDLDGYRARYATYLSDPQLQASRAAAPWMAIWDDHEVENNYAGLVSQDEADRAAFAARRAQAYRAWWENTATRLDAPEPDDVDGTFRIHRGVDVGDLVRISLLDGRQFRSDQISEATLDPSPPPAGWDDPTRTMLGDEQEAWIAERFASSGATWNCLAQQTVLSDTRVGEGVLNYDQWDGYVPARDRLLADPPANLVTLTGDIHLAGIGLLGPVASPVGVEFVSTSISSSANVPLEAAEVVRSLPAIVDAELVMRGYTRHVITPETWTAEYRSVADATDPDSAVTTWKSFRVEPGPAAVTEI